MAERIMMNSYRSRKFSNFRNRYWIKKFKKCIIFSDLVKEWLGSWTNAADETLLLIMDNIQVFNFPKFYRKSVVTYKATNKFQLFLFQMAVPYWNKILSSSNINIREHPMSILGCIRVWMSTSLTFLVLFLFNIILFWCLISLSQIFQNYLSKHVMSNFHLNYKFIIVHMNGSLGIK